MQFFLFVNVTPLGYKISCFRSLHGLSPNNSENTNQRHLPLTGTGHCSSRHSENIHFFSRSFQNNNFFSKSKSLIIWNLGIFNVHHFFMWKHFMCVDCYTVAWPSPMLFYARKQSDKYWLPVKLKWGRANVCQKFKESKGSFVVISYILKINTLIRHGVSSKNKIVQHNTIGPNSKRYQGFHPPWAPLRGLTVNGWLACWVLVSPKFDFQKLASLHMVKYGCNLLGPKSLKSASSQEQIDQLS